MGNKSLVKEKNMTHGQGEQSPELENILEEMMDLKSKLDHEMFIESKELLNEELLMLSMKVDKVIIKYLKTKQKLYLEEKTAMP